jgi:DinB superfamily
MTQSSASDLADEYDAVMADVIAVAGGCSQADWTTSCINEQRSVGVVFDHIAEGNPEAVRWVQEFLNGRPVELTVETLTQRNAEHARRVAARPQGETVADLKAGSARTSEFLRSLTEEQLALTQEFGWAGTKNVVWVAGAAVRHPKGHLKSIKEALGR